MHDLAFVGRRQRFSRRGTEISSQRNQPHKSRVLANYGMRGYIMLERDGVGVAS
jgi:hypothetical protein